MFLICVTTIVFIIGYWKAQCYDKWKRSFKNTKNIFKAFLSSIQYEVSDMLLFGLFGAILGGMAFFILSISCTLSFPAIGTFESTRPLYSFDINETNAYISCNLTKDSKLRYSFITEDSAGCYPVTVDVNYTRIKFVTNDYRVETYRLNYKNKIIDFLCFWAGEDYHYTLYIPKGSIYSESVIYQSGG